MKIIITLWLIGLALLFSLHGSLDAATFLTVVFAYCAPMLWEGYKRWAR